MKPSSAPRYVIWIYSSTVFSSAFLLFQVQPIIAKHILPWFGGSPSVWIASMLFFMSALLVGYGYAHFVTMQKSPAVQIILQLFLVMSSLALLGYLARIWSAPIIPDAAWKPIGSGQPVGKIMTILAISIGLPYVVLATTTSLTQHWFSRIQQKSPYKLYAVSNAASLLALVSYPFIVEPFLSVTTQGRIWSAAYVLYAVLLVTAMALYLRGKKPKRSTYTFSPMALSRRELIRWLGLPTLSSLILLATTSQTSQQIATVPFLWLLPLTLYLLSFIIAFSGSGWYPRAAIAVLFLVSAPLAIALTLNQSTTSITMRIVSFTTVMFLACLVCHGELYRTKPPANRLTLFYLLIAAGGALGALLASLVAPTLFNDVWEYPTALLAITAIAVGVIDSSLLVSLGTRQRKLSVVLLLVLIIGLGVADFTSKQSNDHLAKIRNFYDLITIKRTRHKATQEEIVVMVSGTIVHGAQLTDTAQQSIPTTYYTPQSGGGIALTNHPQRLATSPLRIGAIGLGAGTIAAYCQPGDYIRFYEINPTVIKLAEQYFTYLEQCQEKAQVDVILGDARLSMAQELDQGQTHAFDVLIIDAFTDDAIPVHLLTKEALELYQKHLAPGGIIALHISNKYLDLKPVINGLAEIGTFSSTVIAVGKEQPQSTYATSSEWVLLSHDQDFFNQEQVVQAGTSDLASSQKILWTDDYSNLFRILK